MAEKLKNVRLKWKSKRYGNHTSNVAEYGGHWRLIVFHYKGERTYSWFIEYDGKTIPYRNGQVMTLRLAKMLAKHALGSLLDRSRSKRPR